MILPSHDSVAVRISRPRRSTLNSQPSNPQPRRCTSVVPLLHLKKRIKPLQTAPCCALYLGSPPGRGKKHLAGGSPFPPPFPPLASVKSARLDPRPSALDRPAATLRSVSAKPTSWPSPCVGQAHVWAFLVLFCSSRVVLIFLLFCSQLFPQSGTPGTAWYGDRYGCNINNTQ
jgi:hypothetical protein